MPNEKQYSFFLEDKRRFFNDIPMGEHPFQAVAFQTADKQELTAANLNLLEEEFKQLFATISDLNSEAYWLYCYYCAQLLANYYDAYGKHEQARTYQKIANGIYLASTSPESHLDEDISFRSYIKNKISAGVHEMIHTPFHVSKIKSWVSLVNITRLQLVFSRIATGQIIKYANTQQWIGKLNQLMHLHLDSDAMIAKLNSANGLFNFLSVGLFATRFMLNAAMLLKHLCFPGTEESKVSLLQRFRNEVAKRHCEGLNDAVWGTVNLIANFNWVSASTGNTLMSCFLFFDVSLLVYRRQLAKSAYEIKRSQYLDEIKQIEELIGLTEGEDAAALDEQLRVTRNQLQKLEDTWQGSSANFNCNIAAAVLLMSGFTASLLISAPAAGPISFFVCTIAVAMYLSADLYGNYKEKCVPVERSRRLGLFNANQELKEIQEAKSAFTTSMVKNTLMPMIFLATFSASAPAAVALFCLYVGYESYKGFQAQHPKKDPAPDSVDVTTGVSPQM
ncbi:coiled-coil protein (plasmid) [Legionella adelaidensis]|uniref:Coiled-coil protein n=2 Tax=Legionella adelaidensis TaxID=45056 RepID=A0A0W0R147_9GAMM|nr:coiled-coil protein [Legionella adelaidensis]VEH86191.1 coiled-coil protein [Legionella adelaidensis]